MTGPHRPQAGPPGNPPRVSLRKGMAIPPEEATAPPINLTKPQRQTAPPATPYPPYPQRRDDQYQSSAPIGLGGATPAGGPNRNYAVATFAVLAIVIAVALVALIYQMVGGQDSNPPVDSGSNRPNSPSGESSAEPCSTPPDVTVSSVSMTSAGLAVDTVLSASCGTGDIVTDPQFVLAVTDGTVDVAAGAFDTNSDPIVISPGGSTRRTFVFPVGMFWRTADLVGSNVQATASDTGSASSARQTSSGGSSTLRASAAASPSYGTVDDAALAGLRDLAADDRTAVAEHLQNRWVPQVSSKRTGLVAEGTTWTAANILAEHLDLRQRYPDVKLVWSGDWRTFNGPDWWVTVVGQPSNEASTALSWCASHDLDADHCYAKIISQTLGIDGTTVLQK